jgi:phosphoglycerate dehydrogenase-like enzyme
MFRYSLPPGPPPRCVRRVEKDELFAEDDILSVHVRLSDRTRGLVGAHELERSRTSR